MAREFEIRREVELPGTPEDVWHAVSTEEGLAAWLFPMETDPSQVKVSEPPHHLVVRMEGPDGWFNQIEQVIEARGGSTAVLRYVHSGIFDEDWDNQYDAAGQHTDFYLHTLGQYLAHFKGRPVTYIGGEDPSGIAARGGFEALKQALSVGDDTSAGDRVRFGPDDLDGELTYVNPHFHGVRTADGLYCFFGRDAWGMQTGMTAHLFSDGVDKEATERAWSEWMKGV